MKAAILVIIFFLGLVPPARAQAPEAEQLEWATQLLANSQYQYAATTYEDFIHEYPHSSLLPNAYVGAGDSHFFLKEPQKALEFYQDYENQFPNGKDRWLILLREGQCLYLEGKKDEAAARFKSMDPSSLSDGYRQTYYFYLATALMEAGKLKEAGEDFEKVVAIKSTGQYATLANLRLASILSKAGDDKDATALYDNAMQSGDSLEGQAQVEFIQGVTYLQQQQYDMAAMTFEKIVNGYPNLPVSKNAALDWLIALLKSRQFDQLLAEYDQRFANDYDPANGPIHLVAVDALLAEKKEDDALNILNGVLGSPGISPKVQADASLRKAKILADQGRYDESLQLIDGQTAPDKETGWDMELLKGQNYLGLGDYEKAWDIFSKAAQGDPDNPAIACYEAHTRFAQNHLEEAGGLFEQCFNKSKDDNYRQEALYSAFVMYQKAGKLDEAVKISRLYMSNFPQGPKLFDIVNGTAELLKSAGRMDQANQLFDLARQYQSTQGNPHG